MKDLPILLYMVWELVKGRGIKSLQLGDLRVNRDPWERWGALVLVVLQCHPLVFTNAGGIAEDQFDGLENDALGSSCEDIIESKHYLALLGLQVLDL